MSVQLQLEIDLWGELEDATAKPQSASLSQLCRLLDQAIADLPEQQQLQVAGSAIAQIAQIHSLRAGNFLDENDPVAGCLPMVDQATIAVWVRQSMTVNLDAFVEKPTSKRQRKPNPTDSVVSEVDPTALLALADQLEAERSAQQDPRKMLEDLAGVEDVGRWQQAIASYLDKVESRVCLVDLQKALEMPMVEVWLGLLLGGFSLKQEGEFYDPRDVWIIPANLAQFRCC